MENEFPKTKRMPEGTLIMPGSKRTLLMDDEQQSPGSPATEYVTIGSILNGKYTLTKIIADNTGEAALFIAHSDGENVVAKVYHPNKKPKQEVIDLTSRIQSPHVIRVLENGQIGNRYFEIQPYYEQGDLSRIAPIDEDTIINIVVPCVNEALKAIHDVDIIHRDIKPDNLFYSNDRQRVILGDFGISSKLEVGRTVHATSLSMTLEYSAPETSKGFVSRESDYFSFGITLFELLLGKTPFSGMSYEQIIKSKETDKILIPENINKKLVQLMKGLTLKERKDRWGYAEIKQWIEGKNVPVIENTEVVSNNPYHFNSETYFSLSELAIALGRNWGEAIKHLRRGFLTDYAKKIRQDLASNIMDCEEERDNNIALFKAIYFLHSETPLCWKGEVFENLMELGQKCKHVDPNHVELLQSGMLTYFLEVRKADRALIDEVETLREEAHTDQHLAFYKLSLILNPDNTFEFDGISFNHVDEIVQYLSNQSLKIEAISSRLLQDQYFYAWLEHLGFSEHIEEWKKIQYE